VTSNTSTAIPPSIDTQIMISKRIASAATALSAGSRKAVVEYEFKKPPGSGITIDVELRFSRTVPVGETLSENGQRLGN